MARIIDADTHFLEPPTVYADHIGAGRRDLALHVERDERGFDWLTHRGNALTQIDAHVPGRIDLVGAQRRAWRSGEARPELPEIPDAWDPSARIQNLQAQGVDASIVFPNLGLLWEHLLQHDVVSLSANMQAYNSWLLDLLPDCRDRLYPVAQLHLRDPVWFQGEIRRIADAGIRMAMLAAQPIDGRSLAHPDFDPVWAAFQDLNVSVCFHVASLELPLNPAWYALDPTPLNKLLDTTFLYLPAAVALTSLIVHGKLEQFPGLRIGVTELSAGWVPGYLLHLDGAFAFYEMQNGAPLTRMPLRPSEYFRRQVRVNAFPLEGAARLAEMAGDLFAWGSDYPHAEGMRRPSWSDYAKLQPSELSDAGREALAGGNAAFLLGDPSLGEGPA